MADMEMMKQKWHLLFGLMDINKDKVLSRIDEDECKQAFIQMYGVTGVEAKEVEKHLDAYWDNFVFHGKHPGPETTITELEFIAAMATSFQTKKDETLSVIRDCMKHLLLVADKNSDGFISFEEFTGIYKAYKIGNEKFVRIMFDTIGPNSDGLCPMERVIDFYTEFAMGEDKAKFEKVKAAFAATGMLM